MAPTFALISALLVSQVPLVSGTKTPAFEQTLACMTNDGGCKCAAIGAMDNTSAIDCKGPKAHLDDCRETCCGSPPVLSCYSAMIKNGSICNDDGNSADEWDFSKFSMAAGATASEQLTNCCRKKPIVKCSQVMCASRGDSASRRRSHGASSGAYKAKAGSADTVCKSLGDCERKCCEKNPLMCGGVSPSDASTWCGTNYSTTPTTRNSACDQVATAAMVATFTVSADNASFRSACCTLKPSKTACPANFACPEHYQSKKPMPTTLHDMPTSNHCCDMKANVTQCSDHCTMSGGKFTSTTHKFPERVANSCSSEKKGCASSKCGAGQALDIYLRIDNGATATDATIATKCCFDKPAAAMTNAKCSAFFAAAAAGATKAKTSSCMQGASLPILAVAVLMLMKF